MISRRILLLMAPVVAASLGYSCAWADNPDPRLAVVQSFYDALLATMKDGEQLGFQGRYDKLAPAIQAAFDIPHMTERAIGPVWQDLTKEQRDASVEEFGRYMVATYASRFKSFGGQVFSVQSVKETADKSVVLTQLVKSNGEAVPLAYVMHEADGAWKIADVYYSGSISEIARLRSDFASTLQSGGTEALNKALEGKVAEMGAAP